MSTNRFGFAFNLSAKKYREATALTFIITAVNRVPEETTLEFMGASIFTVKLKAGGATFWEHSEPNPAGRTTVVVAPNAIHSWDYELDPTLAVPGGLTSIVAEAELHVEDYGFSASQELPA